MADQPDLFGPRERARRADPWTSHTAAEMVGRFARGHYGLILTALRQGPGTQHDIAKRVPLRFDQVHKRLPELELYGLVEPTGETKPGPSGTPCRVWALVRREPFNIPSMEI
jgi:hypothetical protein